MGTASFANDNGQVAQLAYGFDTHYQCTWEFLGTEARLVVERGYTPPPGFTPVVRIERQNHREETVLPADNHYRNMRRFFAQTILGGDNFGVRCDAIANQAKYLDQILVQAVRL